MKEEEVIEEEDDNGGNRIRRNFTKTQHSSTWDRQDGLCWNPHCRKVLRRLTAECDHKDGDCSNNEDVNCVYLDRECHAIKSRVETALQHRDDFNIELLELNQFWTSRYISDLRAVCDAKPNLTKEQKEEEQLLILQMC
jgi:hypothetical protein